MLPHAAVIEKLHSVAMRAAETSADIIMDALNHPKAVSHKGRTDLVTETDKQSEQNIISIIRTSFPNHAILAEESGGTTQSTDFLWVIDPLDGTTNFVHGYPSFGVSIAVFYQNKPLIGIVMELPSKQLYTAIKGQGAFCNNSPIHVSEVCQLEQSLLVTGFGYVHDEKWRNNMKLFQHFTDITQGVRRLGSASVDLCHVARGYVDGFWEYDLHPWDTAAGILIVEEAGGRVTTISDEVYSIFDQSITASNGQLHQDIIKHISSTLAQP